MSTLNYTQYGLAPLPSLELEGTEPLRFNVIFGVEDGKVALRYEQPDAPGQTYIAITQNTIVEITLVGDQLFFAKEWEGVTTKEPLSSFYGGVEYDGYDAAVDRYKVIRFQARYNEGGKYGTLHPFNLNVDLLQEAGPGTLRWVGLSIDPDIKNPPPKDD